MKTKKKKRSTDKKRLNKANLQVVQITKADKDQPLLNNVHITPNGDTVGANGAAIVVVQNMKLTNTVPVDFGEDVGITIAAEHIKEVLKALPNDKKFGDLLDRVSLEEEVKEGVGSRTVFKFSDGHRDRVIEARQYPYGYVKYHGIFKKVYSERCLGGNSSCKSFVVNRKRLLSVLSALDKIAPDSSGVFPLFVDVLDNELLIRLEHPRTRQRIVCVVGLSKTDKMLEENEWEKGLVSIDHEEKKRKRKT
jgi:hypothetical protein